MIIFHRILFIGMCMAAFWQGAVDAGRKDLLEYYMNIKLIKMSLYDLGNIKITRL